MSRQSRQRRASRRSLQRCLLKISVPVCYAIWAMQLASWLLAGLAELAVKLTDLLIALNGLIAAL